MDVILSDFGILALGLLILSKVVQAVKHFRRVRNGPWLWSVFECVLEITYAIGILVVWSYIVVPPPSTNAKCAIAYILQHTPHYVRILTEKYVSWLLRTRGFQLTVVTLLCDFILALCAVVLLRMDRETESERVRPATSWGLCIVCAIAYLHGFTGWSRPHEGRLRVHSVLCVAAVSVLVTAFAMEVMHASTKCPAVLQQSCTEAYTHWHTKCACMRGSLCNGTM